MSIHILHLEKSYGKNKVLKNISFEVNKGEIISFLGPNGAGKSTCIKIITGGLIPDSGQVFINEYDLAKEPLKAKSHIGYLPENNPLYKELYVQEYLELIADYYTIKNKKKRIQEVAEQIKLGDVLGKKINILSKGYRQRVGLAQAILHNPDVLILDEPFTGLDPNQLNEMYELIRKWGEDKAILFSSHGIEEAAKLSTRSIIINSGEIVADTPIDESLQSGEALEKMFKELTQ